MSGFFLQLTYYLLIAFVIGTVAQLITGYRRQRALTTFILGFIGVICGDLISEFFHWPLIVDFFGISLVWSLVGAVIFILAFKLIRGQW